MKAWVPFLLFLLLFPLQGWGKEVVLLPLLVRGGVEGEAPALWGGGCLSRGEVPPGAPEEVRQLLGRKLRELRRCELVSPEVEEVPQAMASAPLEASREIGRSLGAEAVLLGALYRYREREGSALGVMRPAAVSLELLLLRVRDGKVLWHVRIDEEQRSLSEDLFKVGRFLRKGLRWLTVREFTEVLLQEALKSFPSLD